VFDAVSKDALVDPSEIEEIETTELLGACHVVHAIIKSPEVTPVRDTVFEVTPVPE
jgi:hypothetical protein